jgi:hypothetical protein
MFGAGRAGGRTLDARAALALAALLVVGACGQQEPVGSGSAPTGPGEGATASAAPGAGTAWDQVLGRIQPDGEVDRQLALDAFVLAFGPLPGIGRPPGASGEIPSGTFALRMLRRFWGTLTPEQQAAAERLIRGEAASASSGTAVLAAYHVPPSRTRLAAAAVTAAEYQAMADKYTEIIAGKLGRVITGDVKVFVNDVQPLDEFVWDADAYIDSKDASGQPQGNLVMCEIHVNPSGQTHDGIDAEGLIAHEVFHCFQDDLSTIAAARARAPWVTEGSASWAEEDLTGGDAYGPGRWARWVGFPTKTLFQRAYDAIGIYFLLEQTGGQPWTVVDNFLEQAASNEGAIAVLRKAGGQAFTDTWGSRYHMEPQLPAWFFDGPGMGSMQVAPRGRFVASAGSQASQTVLAWTAMPYDITIDAEVVVISTENAAGSLARLPAISEMPLVEIDRPLCTLASGCACPADSPNAGQLFIAAAAGDGRLGVTAAAQPATITVIASTLDAFCQSVLVDPCVVGTWASAVLESSDALVGGGDGMILTINEDGTFQVDYDLMEHISGVSYLNTDPSISVEMWFNGTMTGRLTAFGGEYGVLDRNTSDTTMSFSAFINGVEQKVMDREPIGDIAADLASLPNAPTGMFPPDGGAYACSPSQLVFVQDSGKTTSNRQQ